MKEHYRCLWIVPLVLVALVPAGVRSQSKHLTTDKLTTQAEVVAVGKVKETKSEWDEFHSSIRTRVTVSVDEYLKGSGANNLDVYVPGGEVDGVGELYTHMAKFKKDEEVVVFAEKDSNNRYRVSGGDQGKVIVKKDETTGMPMVGGQQSLDDFKVEVRGHAKGQKK